MLARNVRSLKSGEGDVPAAPPALQERLDQLLPLVDRAEKSASVVLGAAEGADPGRRGAGGHQPPVGRACTRRPSVAVRRCKLQAGASAAEIAAAGPAADADAAHRQERQRIPDRRGRECRGRAPARQGPELVPRHRAGRERGQRRAAPARHCATGQARELMQRLLAQYEQIRTARRRDPGQRAGPGRCARGAGRDRRRQRAAAPRPRRPAAGPGERGRLRRPAARRRAAVGAADGRRRLRACCGCSSSTRPAARGWPKPSATRPNARSRKPSASTTPTRRRSCA